MAFLSWYMQGNDDLTSFSFETRSVAVSRRSLYFCQQKAHIKRQRQQVSAALHLGICQLDSLGDVVAFRLGQYRFHTLGIAVGSLYFQWRRLSFITDDEIDLQAGIFMEVIQSPPCLYPNQYKNIFQAK